VKIRGSHAVWAAGWPHTEVDRPWTTLRTSVWTSEDTIPVAVLRPGEIEPDATNANPPEALRALIRRSSFEHPVACHEASRTGYETHRLLSALGVPCEVVAPTMIPRRTGARVTTGSTPATSRVYTERESSRRSECRAPAKRRSVISCVRVRTSRTTAARPSTA
jgi:transposase